MHNPQEGGCDLHEEVSNTEINRSLEERIFGPEHTGFYEKIPSGRAVLALFWNYLETMCQIVQTGFSGGSGTKNRSIFEAENPHLE